MFLQGLAKDSKNLSPTECRFHIINDSVLIYKTANVIDIFSAMTILEVTTFFGSVGTRLVVHGIRETLARFPIVLDHFLDGFPSSSIISLLQS